MEMTGRTRFVFREASNYQIHACHGVWGGPNPHGQLEASFYVDSPLLPVVANMRTSSEVPGLSVLESQDFPVAGDEGDVLHARRLVTGVVLTPADAIAIGEWLIQNATSILAITGRRP
ncbi:hypothetical protein GCM10007235_33170 [Pseudoxanthomonas indica]|nr:hypothetical protein GCM10007235_33170 [Pseudoxanthomonas indica]